MNGITSTYAAAANIELQDRVEILPFAHQVVLVIADGAGGIPGGAKAAESFISGVRDAATSLATPADCLKVLIKADILLGRSAEGGETTGLLVVCRSNHVFGASAGDSMAWIFSSSYFVELTQGQRRKPLLGSGYAAPSSFSHPFDRGTIIAGTDGLWKYAGLESIGRCILGSDPISLATHLANLARLRSGAFPDDIAIATMQT